MWNPSSCKCEYKKIVAHLLTEECKEITDNKIVPIKENISLISCKPFIVSSNLFLSVSVITTSLFVCFYVTSKKKVTRLLLKKGLNEPSNV